MCVEIKKIFGEIEGGRDDFEKSSIVRDSVQKVEDWFLVLGFCVVFEEAARDLGAGQSRCGI